MTTKTINTLSEYFTNFIKDLNLCESTGNINFENEESCKKVKGNFANKIFCFELLQ